MNWKVLRTFTTWTPGTSNIQHQADCTMTVSYRLRLPFIAWRITNEKEFTMSSEHNYKRMVVQQFIKDKTGRNVLIVFNKPHEMERHLFLLDYAYRIAKEYYDKIKTTNKNWRLPSGSVDKVDHLGRRNERTPGRRMAWNDWIPMSIAFNLFRRFH